MAYVRLATEDDAPEVARLLADLPGSWGAEAPSQETLERCVRRLLPDQGAEFLVGSLDEHPSPVGVAQLRFRYLVWLDDEECELEDLFVHSAARRAGVGRALMEAAIERARARGCRRMHIVANEANECAIPLYESFGFSAWFDPLGGHNLDLRRML